MQETEKAPSLRERATALFRRNKEDESGAPRRKRGKRVLLAAVVLLLAAAVVLPRLGGAGTAGNTVSPLDVMALSPTDLRQTISATGTVESARSVLV